MQCRYSTFTKIKWHANFDKSANLILKLFNGGSYIVPVRRSAVTVYRLLIWLRDHILRVCEVPALSTTWFVSDFTCFSLWSDSDVIIVMFCLALSLPNQGTLGKVPEAQHFLPSIYIQTVAHLHWNSFYLTFFRELSQLVHTYAEYGRGSHHMGRPEPWGASAPNVEVGLGLGVTINIQLLRQPWFVSALADFWCEVNVIWRFYAPKYKIHVYICLKICKKLGLCPRPHKTSKMCTFKVFLRTSGARVHLQATVIVCRCQ